jgi:3-hydroxybutyryl-CoA dehydrogenase
MAIQKVGVVGCGLMGSGIAQVAAASGFSTLVREVSAELLDKGLKGIDKNLKRRRMKSAGG